MAIDALRRFYGVWVGGSITSGFTDCGPRMILNCLANEKAKNDIIVTATTPAMIAKGRNNSHLNQKKSIGFLLIKVFTDSPLFSKQQHPLLA